MNGFSAIHTTIASSSADTCGSLPGLTSMSPRLTSISSASVTVTAIGLKASSSSPSYVTIDFTLLRRPDGSATTSSPLRMIPDAIVPENPRKLRFGRRTYCTGNRMSARLRSDAMCTDSRWLSSGGPSYHGMAALLVATFSPLRADIGMNCTSGMPSLATKPVYSRWMRS